MSTNKISPGMEFHDFASSLQRSLGLVDDRDVNAFLHWSIKEQALLNNPMYLDHIEYMLDRSTLQLPMVEHDANMAEDHMDRLISWHVFQDPLNESEESLSDQDAYKKIEWEAIMPQYKTSTSDN